jgi:hypothetical protein
MLFLASPMIIVSIIAIIVAILDRIDGLEQNWIYFINLAGGYFLDLVQTYFVVGLPMLVITIVWNIFNG